MEHAHGFKVRLQSGAVGRVAELIERAPPPLPAGWREAKHPDGRTYYFATGTTHTQWTRPTESAAAMGLVASLAHTQPDAASVAVSDQTLAA